MKRIAAIICFLAVLMSTTALAAPIDKVMVDVKLVPVSVDDVLNVETVEELNSLLYPSGMQLPTMYLDFLMFSNIGEETIVVSRETYDFLLSAFPTDGNCYTLAECFTAKLYLSWYQTAYGDSKAGHEEEAKDIVAVATDLGWQFVGDVTANSVTDLDRLQSEIQKYYAALDIAHLPEEVSYNEVPEYQDMVRVSESNGIQLSSGFEYLMQCDELEPIMGLDLQAFRSFVNTRGLYMDMLGISVFGAGRALFGEETEGESAVVGGSTGTPAISSETNMNKPEGFNDLDIDTVTPNEGISDFDSGYTSSDVTDGSIAFRDVTVAIALAVIVVAIVVYGVRDWYRKYKDPTRRWRW